MEISGNTIAVSVGSKHTCALSDETPSSYHLAHEHPVLLGGWGEWQARTRQRADSDTPLEVTFSRELTPRSVSSGSDSTCIISSSEETYCWGDNDKYEIGEEWQHLGEHPRRSPDSDGSVGVAVGGLFACALSDSGGNSPPQCTAGGSGTMGSSAGTGTVYVSSTATLAGILGSERDYDSDDVIAIMDSHHPGGQSGSTVISTKVASGEAHSCAIDASGNVSCWGFNAYGELGNGVTVNPAGGGVTPTGHPVTADLPGVRPPGRLPQEAPSRVPCWRTTPSYCWGQNNVNQLGTGGTPRQGSHSTARRTIHLQPGLRSQSRGDGGSHTCAISTGDNVWCWGSDTNGELGKGGLVRMTQFPTMRASAGTITVTGRQSGSPSGASTPAQPSRMALCTAGATTRTGSSDWVTGTTGAHRPRSTWGTATARLPSQPGTGTPARCSTTARLHAGGGTTTGSWET